VYLGSSTGVGQQCSGLTQGKRSTAYKLLDAEGQGPQVAEARAEPACPERSRRVEAWERELNALVYESYRLTDEKTGVVEGV